MLDIDFVAQNFLAALHERCPRRNAYLGAESANTIEQSHSDSDICLGLSSFAEANVINVVYLNLLHRSWADAVKFILRTQWCSSLFRIAAMDSSASLSILFIA